MTECILCGTYFKQSSYRQTIGDYNRAARICSFCWDSDTEDVLQEKALYKFYRHEDNIKRNYGIDGRDFRNLLKSQNYRCAICKNVFDLESKRMKAHVDHCHNSLKVRALLCSNCNMMLGHARENIQTLLSAISYLVKHSED